MHPTRRRRAAGRGPLLRGAPALTPRLGWPGQGDLTFDNLKNDATTDLLLEPPARRRRGEGRPAAHARRGVSVGLCKVAAPAAARRRCLGAPRGKGGGRTGLSEQEAAQRAATEALPHHRTLCQLACSHHRTRLPLAPAPVGPRPLPLRPPATRPPGPRAPRCSPRAPFDDEATAPSPQPRLPPRRPQTRPAPPGPRRPAPQPHGRPRPPSPRTRGRPRVSLPPWGTTRAPAAPQATPVRTKGPRWARRPRRRPACGTRRRATRLRVQRLCVGPPPPPLLLLFPLPRVLREPVLPPSAPAHDSAWVLAALVLLAVLPLRLAVLALRAHAP